MDVFQVIADKKYHVENDKQDERDANIAAILFTFSLPLVPFDSCGNTF